MELLGDYTLRIVALGAGVLGATGGALGSFAVLRRQSLLGDAVSHAALPGIAIAFLLTGSKAPLVILDDADLDQAVAAAAFGAYMNQGQICMSTERLVVDEAVADAFVEKMTAKVESMKAGDPREGKTPLGSVVDASATQRITGLIQK